MRFSLQALLFALGASRGFSQIFAPQPTDDCNLFVALDLVGSIAADATSNIASPVPVGNDLYLIDQKQGKIFKDKNGNGKPFEIFDLTQAPEGLTFGYADTIVEYISNVSPGPSQNELYVGFESLTLPEGVIAYGGPDLPSLKKEWHSSAGPTGLGKVDLYQVGALEPCGGFCCLCQGIFGEIETYTFYHVIYKFTIQPNSVLVDPVPLAAFAGQSGPTHKGSGMATLPDGRLLLATGDGLPFGTNGREGAQDDETPLSKLFAIAPDGTVELLAKGLRQPQHLEFVDTGDAEPTLLAIGEIGGVTSEEINVVSLEDLLDTSFIENFGWGIGPDGKGREGTFYTYPGIAGIFGTQPPAYSDEFPPVPEPGYIQPHAQYGRLGTASFVAVSGPVTSRTSFGSLKTLFADLNSGQFLATVGNLDDAGVPGFYGTDEEVCKVRIWNEDTNSFYETANDFANPGEPARLDSRFFRFPDGTAGVLFEKTGKYYRITQVESDVIV